MNNLNKGKEGKLDNKGFTLVELIVVLVIIAILIGLGIYAFTGYIDRANKKKVIAECRQCVAAAQTTASEGYATGTPMTNGNAMDEENRTAIEKLAEVEGLGEITAIKLGTKENEGTGQENGVIKKLVWKSKTGYIVTYENGKYTISDKEGSTPSFGDKTFIDTFTEIAQKVTSQTVSSQGVKYSPNDHAKNFIEQLKQQGIDLDAMGAKSWKYTKAGLLYWTPEDIDQYSEGDTIPIMRYNFKTGTYTVWNMNLTNTSVTGGSGQEVKYLDIGKEGKSPLNTDQSYEGMVAAYKEATKQ